VTKKNKAEQVDILGEAINVVKTMDAEGRTEPTAREQRILDLNAEYEKLLSQASC
jgi:hypothetical protein